ncbi:MAG: tetratricopeptide repeat protein [Bdellovibrionales bacterium]|nr:tetratricopeptide repeat protein [Bdellovibrionales bacterium]NQZ18613.1 tetratricopeptide repeat protein [Bdellovibrionales bacterium]
MSQQYDAKKIEEYQLVLLKNPRSPVFAALAEAYRKMGLLEEALETTHKGLRHNPEFVSGLVAHAKVLYEMRNYSEALRALKKATLLKPENLLALRLTAHCYIKQKKHLIALKTYKKLLTMSPNDEKAQTFIRKWEFLESLSFSDVEIDFNLDQVEDWVGNLPGPEYVVHLVDSFLGQNDEKTAARILDVGRLMWPRDHDLKEREAIVYKDLDPRIKEKLFEVQVRKEFYQNLLHRIESGKRVDPSQRP